MVKCTVDSQLLIVKATKVLLVFSTLLLDNLTHLWLQHLLQSVRGHLPTTKRKDLFG